MDESAAACPACGSAAPGATASFEPVGAAEGGAAALETIEGPVLVVRKGPQPGERFYLDRPNLTIGRDPASDIFLNDMTVSRAHAVLRTAAGTVRISDVGSLNGTYVNGVCVDEAQLTDGDVVQVGTFQMVYHGEATAR
jgi:pSer/pThr/pTyr-binding forkhead associated (FHA) protein